MMASKSIVQRQRAISFVLAAALAHVQDVLPALAERLAPFLEEGETMPDFELVQRLVGRLLAATRTRLVAADKDHLDDRSVTEEYLPVPSMGTLVVVLSIPEDELYDDKDDD